MAQVVCGKNRMYGLKWKKVRESSFIAISSEKFFYMFSASLDFVCWFFHLAKE